MSIQINLTVEEATKLHQIVCPELKRKLEIEMKKEGLNPFIENIEIEKWDERLVGIKIDNKWVGSIISTKTLQQTEKISDHIATLFLSDVNGNWYTGDGNKIQGTLFFKPRK